MKKSVDGKRKKMNEEKKNYIQRGDNMARTRKAAVNLINSWVGKNEKDGSYKSILDIYNKQKTKPRGVTMKPGMAWCATTWSAVAIALGYTDIMPVECSCYYLIKRAQKMGCWKENDGYIPKIGDACLYDWKDNGIGDNKGTPKHVGMVTYVNRNEGYFVVTEGNYKDSVKKRTVSINGKFIRGFITPKYDVDQPKISTHRRVGKDIKTVAREVIVGQWGEDYKSNLKAKHYNVTAVIKEVNAVINTPCGLATTTCSAAYVSDSYKKAYKTSNKTPMRIDAGWNKKLMVEIPAGRKVECYGYFNKYKKSVWLLCVVTIKGKKYTGFVEISELV
jgi:hypothetical protein